MIENLYQQTKSIASVTYMVTYPNHKSITKDEIQIGFILPFYRTASVLLLYAYKVLQSPCLSVLTLHIQTVTLCTISAFRLFFFFLFVCSLFGNGWRCEIVHDIRYTRSIRWRRILSFNQFTPQFASCSNIIHPECMFFTVVTTVHLYFLTLHTRTQHLTHLHATYSVGYALSGVTSIFKLSFLAAE